jgi:hypothetical protein
MSTNSSQTRRVQARIISNNLDACCSSCAAVRTSRGNAGTKESISNVDFSTPSLVDGVIGLCPVIMPANIVVAQDFVFAATVLRQSGMWLFIPKDQLKIISLEKRSIFQQLNLA